MGFLVLSSTRLAILPRVQISTKENAQRKYHRIVELPAEADIDTVKSTYKNGILEITFSKKAKPKGKEIKVE